MAEGAQPQTSFSSWSTNDFAGACGGYVLAIQEATYGGPLDRQQRRSPPKPVPQLRPHEAPQPPAPPRQPRERTLLHWQDSTN